MALPVVLVTGASGFVGRSLVPALLPDWHVVGLGRRAEGRAGIPPHPNLAWFQADIGDPRQLQPLARHLAGAGRLEAVVHLAAQHAGTGSTEDAWRTNVVGLRNILDVSARTGARQFVYLSAVAACRPTAGTAKVTEASAAHRRHVMAVTKGEGEAMLFEYADRLKPVIVRAAALFSDWCESPALFARFERWRSAGWTRNVVRGDGSAAAPYLHINDLALFLLEVLAKGEALDPCEVLIASPDAPVSERELFDAFALATRGARAKPVFVPRAAWRAAAATIHMGRWLSGRSPDDRAAVGEIPEGVLAVDASRTRRRLDWSPRPRLELLRRLPFLVENIRVDPYAWVERNQGRRVSAPLPVHLKIHWLLELHQDSIFERFHELLTGPRGRERFPRYQGLGIDRHEWHHRLALRNLENAVRTQDRGVFMGYCRDLAEQRMKEGFSADELCGALEMINLACWQVLRRDPETRGLRQALFDTVTSTLRAGCDQAQEVFELAQARARRTPSRN